MRANPDFTLRTIGDISLIVSLTDGVFDRGRTVTTNESGRLLWQALGEECTEEKLIGAIRSVYEIDEATARADIGSFLDSLRAAGALML